MNQTAYAWSSQPLPSWQWLYSLNQWWAVSRRKKSSQWKGDRPAWKKSKGRKIRKADLITEEEEEQMWAAKVLGDESPRSLNFTVWYLLTQQFDTWGCQEHHQLFVQDLNFINDPSGKPYYVECMEGMTKTCRGGPSEYKRQLPRSVCYG